MGSGFGGSAEKVGARVRAWIGAGRGVAKADQFPQAGYPDSVGKGLPTYDGMRRRIGVRVRDIVGM
jgi:hypothetical protein